MNKRAYLITNIATIILAALCFIYKAVPELKFTFDKQPIYIDLIIFLMAGFVVYCLKCLRLYIILYGKGISLSEHIRQFCKATAVSIILPFKLGELFRAYCYAYQLKDSLLGISSIIIDRFCDTVALIMILGLFITVGKLPVNVLFIVILLFSIFVIFIYSGFPAIYNYWNRYFIKAKATTNNLRSLVFLYNMQKLYKEISLLIQGRGILLFLLSLVSWIVEIGSVSVISIIKAESITANIGVYLNAAMGIGYSANHWYYIVISLVLLFVVYVLLYSVGMKNRW